MNTELLRTLFAWSGQAGNPLPVWDSNHFKWGRMQGEFFACYRLVVYFWANGTVTAYKRVDAVSANREQVEVETPAQLIDLLNWVKSGVRAGDGAEPPP